MILLYTILCFLLGMIKLLVGLRARALERKFIRVAAAVDEMLRQPDHKPGNSNKTDPCLSAKRMLLLGQLATQRDRVEAKYFAWQRWAERLARWVETLRDWKGKTVPYTLGAVDVWMLMQLIDYLSVGQFVSTWNVIQLAMSLWSE